MTKSTVSLKSALAGSALLGAIGLIGMMSLHEASNSYTQQSLARQIAPTIEFATTIPAEARVEVAAVR